MQKNALFLHNLNLNHILDLDLNLKQRNLPQIHYSQTMLPVKPPLPHPSQQKPAKPSPKLLPPKPPSPSKLQNQYLAHPLALSKHNNQHQHHQQQQQHHPPLTSSPPQPQPKSPSPPNPPSQTTTPPPTTTPTTHLHTSRRALLQQLSALKATHTTLHASLSHIEEENEGWRSGPTTPNSAALGRAVGEKMDKLRREMADVERQERECHRRWEELGEEIERTHVAIAFGGE